MSHVSDGTWAWLAAIALFVLTWLIAPRHSRRYGGQRRERRLPWRRR